MDTQTGAPSQEAPRSPPPQYEAEQQSAPAAASASLLDKLQEAVPAASPLFDAMRQILPTPVSRSRTPRPSVKWGRPLFGPTEPPKLVAYTLGKEVDEGHTVICMVIDRSGSMSSMGPEVAGGCNAYLDEQRKTDGEDGTRTSLTFIRFDNHAEAVHDGVALSDVPEVTNADVKPRGGTALYDAIGSGLTKTAALLEKLDKAPARTVVFVLTDGQENSSHRYNKSAVTSEIERLQAQPYGWEFYFAAANQDAMVEGAALGVNVDQCLSFDASPATMNSCMVSASQAQTRMKRGKSKSFTPQERASSSPAYAGARSAQPHPPQKAFGRRSATPDVPA